MHSNGVIYIDTSTTPHKGVSIADIQQTLGRGVNDIGLLCSDQEWVDFPYQRVAYLESSGTQYIDTGLKPIAGEVIEITFQYVGTQSTIVFGCRTDASNGKFTIGSGSSGTKIYAALGSAGNTNLADYDTAQHTVVLNAGTGKAKIDNSAEVSVGTFSENNLNIHLFACKDSSSVSYKSTARIMSVKIGDRAHFFPVKSNSVGYMYDLVSGALFGNDGTGSFTIGADVNDKMIRTVNRVNKWAKYKPVRLSILNTDGQLEEDTTNHRMVWKSSADWWKGEGLQPTCGFSVPSYAGIDALIETNDVWQYLRPRGMNGGGQGVHEWFRFKDFNQYNHNAVCPINIGLPDDTTVTTTIARNVGVSLVLKADAVLPDYNLKLTDIGNYGNMYLGLVVVKGEQAYIKTNSQTIGTGYGGTLIALDGCPLISSAGTVMLYAVLVSSVESSWTDVYEGSVVSLNVEEGAGVCELTIVEPQQNAYKIVLNGLTTSDMRQWTRRGVIACTLTGGSLVGSDVQKDNMANNYNLVSVNWKVVKHSAPAVTIRQGSLSSLTNVNPDTLEARIDAPDPDYNGGQLVNFNAPYEVGTLPALADDYYIPESQVIAARRALAILARIQRAPIFAHALQSKFENLIGIKMDDLR